MLQILAPFSPNFNQRAVKNSGSYVRVFTVTIRLGLSSLTTKLTAYF